MNKSKYKIHKQESAYDSPWSLSERVVALLWEICWTLFCVWTPKPLNGWRLLWLRIFGCKINGNPFVHQRARVQIPWNLILHDRACLGDRANAYSLNVIEIKKGATIAQEAYLCAATHDFSNPDRPLKTSKITIGENAFVGARAFVMPGIQIGEGSVIGACSVVTKDIPPGTTGAGNPFHPVEKRTD